VRRIAGVLMVALPLALAAIIAWKAVDLPFMDEWEWADLVYSMHQGTLQFSQLWAQHNEHRLLVPNIIMLGLARFGGWDPVREQFVSLAVLVLTQIAIIALMRRSAHATLGAVAAAAACLMLYELSQAQNFAWGFQIAWFICDACAVIVAWLLSRPDRRAVHVFLALIAAAIATYSSSQGILAWAVGAVAILLTFRKRVPTLSVWLPAAVVAYFVYNHGLARVDTGHVNVLAHPVDIVLYVLTYLGSPIAGGRGDAVSAVIGLALLVALSWALYADMRSPYRVRRLVRNAPWYALAVFPVLCAAGTAAGRAGFGVDQALEGRYITISLLGWVALIGLLAGFAARLPRPLAPRMRSALLALTVVFVFSIVSEDDKGFKQWSQIASNLTEARHELIRSDPAALAKIYPIPSRVIVLIGKMRQVHDGPFAGE
jgi:hypothetical protein